MTNDAAIALCDGSMTFVSVDVVRPPTVKVIDVTPPTSSADTIADVVCPGLTFDPEEVPVIVTTGLTASTTVTETGAAWTTCPFTSTADASITIDEPGTAVAGML